MTLAMASHQQHPPPVVAVVPVKPLDLAKSRLELAADRRRPLVLAFAADTLHALASCLEVASIVVVTADQDVAALAGAAGATVLPDEADGLDSSIAAALPAAVRAHPGAVVLICPADLPCLRATDVSAVLALAAGGEGAFVPDRSGTGTTLIIQPPGRPARTHYGPGSAARHTALGLTALTGAPLRARHDVDTLADLRYAVRLGLGAHSAALVDAGGDVTEARSRPRG
jgi:2-phospho-L-lactate guanylyltransferase